MNLFRSRRVSVVWNARPICVRQNRTHFDGTVVEGSEVCALGEAFDLKVIAEGVATREQALRLAMDGCTQGPGYYFGRPVTAAAFTGLYVSGEPALMNIGFESNTSEPAKGA
jgi:predicted signal transduction protein with EAL and GGDEF domain